MLWGMTSWETCAVHRWGTRHRNLCIADLGAWHAHRRGTDVCLQRMGFPFYVVRELVDAKYVRSLVVFSFILCFWVCRYGLEQENPLQGQYESLGYGSAVTA